MQVCKQPAFCFQSNGKLSVRVHTTSQNNLGRIVRARRIKSLFYLIGNIGQHLELITNSVPYSDILAPFSQSESLTWPQFSAWAMPGDSESDGQAVFTVQKSYGPGKLS
jgi:hypothetical protein